MHSHPGHTCKIGDQAYNQDPIDAVRQCAVCGRRWLAYMPAKPRRGEPLALTRWKPLRWYSRWTGQL